MSRKPDLMKEVNQDTGVMIKDHEYRPRNPAEPWGLCDCGLAEATHQVAVEPYKITSPRAVKEAKPLGPKHRKKLRAAKSKAKGTNNKPHE